LEEEGMENPISKGLKIIFIVHMIISTILGLGLWLVPGRFLLFIGWVPEYVTFAETERRLPGTNLVDPYITRFLGAALLALAYSSFRGWRMQKWIEVALVVQVEALFYILGLLAIIWKLVQYPRPIPAIGYLLFVIITGFAVAWTWALRSHTAK
jgi:hypothetical protein